MDVLLVRVLVFAGFGAVILVTWAVGRRATQAAGKDDDAPLRPADRLGAALLLAMPFVAAPAVVVWATVSRNAQRSSQLDWLWIVAGALLGLVTALAAVRAFVIPREREVGERTGWGLPPEQRTPEQQRALSEHRATIERRRRLLLLPAWLAGVVAIRLTIRSFPAGLSALWLEFLIVGVFVGGLLSFAVVMLPRFWRE